MDLLTYFLFRCFVFLFRIIPFPLLYLISDGFYFLFYYIAGYRKKVVYENLRSSFPEKSATEIRTIARGFFHHLADVLVESMKAFSMTEAEVVKRYRLEGMEELDELYRQGKPVICVAGHYANWELAGIAAGSQMAHKPVGFYKPMTNKRIDAYIRKTRVKGRSELASITATNETFRKDYGDIPVFYMVADQSPSSPRLAYWMNFLNHDTAVLHGPEKYAHRYNFPVVFAWAEKVRRGYYIARFTMLEKDPAHSAPGQITEKYIRALEQVILENPQYYLWSHRRWKLKR